MLPLFKIDSLGFHSLTEAKYGASYQSYKMQDVDRLNLQQIFSAPTEWRDDGIGYKALNEQYKTYSRYHTSEK